MVGSIRGDLWRTRDAFDVSLRAWTGARVFLTTTTGGIELLRELMDEPGLIFCELPGLCGIVVVPFEGNLFCPAPRDEEASEMTEPVVDAILRRRLD